MKRVSTMIAALGLSMTMFGVTLAETPQRELEQLAAERQRLHAELTAADRAAARSVLAGEKPFEDYARQTRLQEELDLVSMRMEVLASRHGLALPELSPAEGAEDEPTAGVAQARDVLGVGEARTQREMARTTARLLASIDFRGFLEGVE